MKHSRFVISDLVFQFCYSSSNLGSYVHNVFVLFNVEYLELIESCMIKSRMLDRPVSPILQPYQIKFSQSFKSIKL